LQTLLLRSKGCGNDVLKPGTKRTIEQTISNIILNNQNFTNIERDLDILKEIGLIGPSPKRDMLLLAVVYYLRGACVSLKVFLEQDMSLDEFLRETMAIILGKGAEIKGAVLSYLQE
jgi:hypothetical protein